MANINDTLAQLRSEYLAESDPDRRQALMHQYNDAVHAALRIVGKSIAENTAQYETAVDRLQSAIDALHDAKKQLGDVSAAVKKVATAVDEFVRVAGTIAAV